MGCSLFAYGLSILGNKLSENFEKINYSLMQTQEFQQVATSIEGWVNTTQNTLKHLQPIAARVGLIESQLEGLKVRTHPNNFSQITRLLNYNVHVQICLI